MKLVYILLGVNYRFVALNFITIRYVDVASVFNVIIEIAFNAFLEHFCQTHWLYLLA